MPRKVETIEKTPPPPIEVGSKCCRTCKYVYGVKQVKFACSHPRRRIFIKGRGEVAPLVGKDDVCEDWESNPMLAKFHGEGK